MRFGTSPCVLLMAKPTPGAKPLSLSSPQHFSNASSPRRLWVSPTDLSIILRCAVPARVARRPQGGPFVQFAGWLS